MNTKKKIFKIIIILFLLQFILVAIVFLAHNFTQKTHSESNISTLQELLLLIDLFLSFFIIGNFLIHRYYKRQHSKILEQIKSTEYNIFKNLKLTQTWNFGFQLNRADLIITKNEIIILIFNSNLNGLIKQAQPAILFL